MAFSFLFAFNQFSSGKKKNRNKKRNQAEFSGPNISGKRMKSIKDKSEAKRRKMVQ